MIMVSKTTDLALDVENVVIIRRIGPFSSDFLVSLGNMNMRGKIEIEE